MTLAQQLAAYAEWRSQLAGGLERLGGLARMAAGVVRAAGTAA